MLWGSPMLTAWLVGVILTVVVSHILLQKWY
jgi:hypothetical protein